MSDNFSSNFTQDFLTSRRNFTDGETRIGEYGRLWYDSITNTIRIGDGVTPGGIIVSGGGAPGGSGYSGFSGYSGWSGITGSSGYSGISGFSGSGVKNWTKITSTYTASNGDRLIADTSSGSFTVYLPPSPTLGDYVQIFDGSNFSANPLTVDGNGSTIEGSLPDVVLTEQGAMYDFIFDGSTWQLTGGSGISGASGFSGYSGATGADGVSGYSGFSGFSGAAGGGVNPWIRETSYYLSSNGDRIIADTSAGSFTIDLPATPVTGDYVVITDGADFMTNNLIVGRNGSTIEGLADDVALDMKGVTFEFIYSVDTWHVTATTGASGFSGYSGYSGALDPWKTITSNYYASPNNRLIGDTSAGSFTVYLPSSPIDGYYVQITDGDNFAINNLFVDPNGSTIEGLADVVALDLKGVTYEFIFNSPTWNVTGTTGARGESGFSGYSGYSGLGLSGYSGVSGYSGAAGDSSLVWSVSGTQRILTGYVDDDGSQSTVRKAEFLNDLLYLTLATFTPTLTSSGSPGGSLSWDVPVTGFNVNVVNPTDFLTQYVSTVSAITATSGSISALGTFTAGSQSATPAGGVSWTQSFTTNVGSYIRSNSTTISGGSAVGTVSYDYWNGTSTVPFSGTSTVTINWATPTLAVTLASLSGQTFLTTYPSTTYTVTVTGMNSSANYVNSVSASGGSVSNATGSGTFTFTDPIHKNNTATVRTVSSSTTFTRPINVTGTSYSVGLSSTSSSPSVTFTYPSLWRWMSSTLSVPGTSDFVTGSTFAAGVTVLANQTKVISAYINNTDTVPKGFWFAVRTSVSQPTTFKTGPSPSLLSDVAVVTGNTVSLYPSVPPSGYIAESYTLYGITLQPGSTYVSIS